MLSKLEAVEKLRRFFLSRRHRLDIKQSRAAELCQMSVGWVGSLEAGRFKSPPKDDTMRKIATGLTLTGELPGDLYNFLELVIAGTFSDGLIVDVAQGIKSPIKAMSEAASGVSTMSDGRQGYNTSQNQDAKMKRLDRILNQMRLDLSDRDFAIGSIFMKRLYDIEH